ncbi:hypothetical protein DICVIV_00702 [Dictyocaulus viviparus]|uniref:Uncharacterized protein n=1 Tax=Dictyocaulus viviparus TaxID=29172 RepID=A0A0D8Y9Z0_DICVI|nr:hypothetical protein DICVIV_00702 [Dictyocaulus viviparus]
MLITTLSLMKMAKQEFDPVDYFGPIVVAAIFSITLFLISFFVINFFCITKYDDVTKFEKMGAKRNIQLGPHKLLIMDNSASMIEELDDDRIYYPV